tara:strand:+ start:60985 stop:63168 length:2184 start_codon:yes stop_codon:yes gene_type:complete
MFLFLLWLPQLSAQAFQQAQKFEIKGSVKGNENRLPISGVLVYVEGGNSTYTNGLGEFSIRVSLGDRLVVQDASFETVYHIIRSKEEVDVLVEGYEAERYDKRGKVNPAVPDHSKLLDSANFYKDKDIEKSLDYITRSMLYLDKRGNREEMAASLLALGQVYDYHKQYDLAIAAYLDALTYRNTAATSLLLGESYLLKKEYKNAESVLLPLLKDKKLSSYGIVQVYEGLGDAKLGLGDTKSALEHYENGLALAEKRDIVPKMTDLNSKMADALAKGNRTEEADRYYNNSLEMASTQAPQRAVRENEKVADFYNSKNQYGAEIALRKKSLDELKVLPQKKVTKNVATSQTASDTITAQRINYKIANAYIAQDKLDEAIPYLQQSIAEADTDDDLVVQKDAIRKLSEVYRYKGDYDKALEAYQQYVAVVDTLYIRKEQEIGRATRLNREIANKQIRIAGLEQERALSQSKYDLALTEQQLIAESNKRQKWIIYSLILGILLLGMGIYLFYRSGKQQKLANNLLALKSLRSQMNPHFIFNALNSVNNYIAKNDERSANRYLSTFSSLMRSVLENSEQDFIPLSKELELLQLYIQLEHSRFSDKFDYVLKVVDGVDVDSFEIPPMLLQPYLENAIWHGLRYKEAQGMLKIEVLSPNRDMVVIMIEDNGIGRKRSGELKTGNQLKQKSKGMGNIEKRIAILNEMYRDRVSVTVSDLLADGTGTKVVLTLKRK